VLAADLLTGNEDPRRDAAELLRRALAALPTAARAGRIQLRADTGYFAGQLARAALFADIDFAIGAHRIAPLWRLLDGVAEADWTDALDMPAAQVAVADYCPNWWQAATRLLIRRIRLDVDGGQVSADPRARLPGSGGAPTIGSAYPRRAESGRRCCPGRTRSSGAERVPALSGLLGGSWCPVGGGVSAAQTVLGSPFGRRTLRGRSRRRR
jgi:hypothetical protein